MPQSLSIPICLVCGQFFPSVLLISFIVAFGHKIRYNLLGAKSTRAASEREKIMYDPAYIIALFEALSADAQQEILDLAVRLAADANSKE